MPVMCMCGTPCQQVVSAGYPRMIELDTMFLFLMVPQFSISVLGVLWLRKSNVRHAKTLCSTNCFHSFFDHIIECMPSIPFQKVHGHHQLLIYAGWGPSLMHSPPGKFVDLAVAVARAAQITTGYVRSFVYSYGYIWMGRPLVTWSGIWPQQMWKYSFTKPAPTKHLGKYKCQKIDATARPIRGTVVQQGPFQLKLWPWRSLGMRRPTLSLTKRLGCWRQVGNLFVPWLVLFMGLWAANPRKNPYWK